MSIINVSDEEDEIIAKVKEESLKYFNEHERSRINLTPCSSKIQNDVNVTPNTSNAVNNEVCELSQSCSKPICYEGKEAEGFYIAAGNSFIYPTNYPVRQYQEQIVRTAIFKNTLVSLPTGLGKTFIAAVVMYNFYRWYPNGKIIFMAPTKPLVAQQIRACYNIMNLPLCDTTELTGSLGVKERKELWKEKRVFFLTPQVLVNDLQSGTCCGQHIKCLVVDEAHKAVKDYAYCQAVKVLEQNGVAYRLLALSATPGNDVAGVQQVIKNLKITALEFRGEDSLDVVPYTHSRSVESVPVELSVSIQRVKGDFLKVYDKYAKRLREVKALSSNIATLSKFQILKAYERFKSHPPNGMQPSVVGSLSSDFAVCMSMAHALELLQIYGIRAFFNCIKEGGGEKSKAATTRIKNDPDLKKILNRLEELLSIKPGSEKYLWGHPKLFKLVKIITQHFASCEEKGETSKVIVFCQYRVVVNEVVELLESLNSSQVKPVMFIGQSNGKDKGMNQAKQLQIMKEFRSGVYNCLIATCVAEEGLDIGEVDLIILMEAHKSPIRLVQRIGRTGRKRSGKCVVLLTKGKEEYKFHEAMAARKSYVTNILSSKGVKSSLCEDNPPMFPPGMKPEKLYLHIKVNEPFTPIKPPTVKQSDIRKSLVVEESPFLDLAQYNEVVKELGKSTLDFGKIPDRIEMFPNFYDKKMPVDDLLKKDINRLSEWKDWNLELHGSYEISHSENSQIMVTMNNRFRGALNSFLKISGTQNKRQLESDDEACPSKEQQVSKKPKREVVRKNFGMDIRHCMAAAAAGRKKEKEATTDNCEVIEIDDNTPDNESNGGFNEQLVDDIIHQLDAVLKKMNSGKRWVCPFKEDVVKGLDACFKSLEIQGNSRWSEKPKISIDDSFWDGLTPGCFRVQKVDSVVESVAGSEDSDLNDSKEGPLNESISFLPTPKFETSIAKPDKPIQSENHIDSIDDAFFNNINMTDLELSSDRKSRENLVDEDTNDFVSLDDLFDENDEFPDKIIKASSDDIGVSPPKGTADTDVIENVFSQEKMEVEPYVKDRVFNTLSEKPKNSPFVSKVNQNLVASTPKAKVCLFAEEEKTEAESGKLAKELENEADVWNVSDLFEEDFPIDDEIETKTDKDFLEKSTLMGITQMVSLIEEEKRKKLSSDREAVKEIRESAPSKAECDKGAENRCGRNNAISLLDEDDDLFACVEEPIIVPYEDSVKPIKGTEIENKVVFKSNEPSTSSTCEQPKNTKNFKKFHGNKNKVEPPAPCGIKLITVENPTVKLLPSKKFGLSLKSRPEVVKVNKRVENHSPQLSLTRPVKDDSCYFDFPVPNSKESALSGERTLKEVETLRRSDSSLEKSIKVKNDSDKEREPMESSSKKSSFDEFSAMFGQDDDDVFQLGSKCRQSEETRFGGKYHQPEKVENGRKKEKRNKKRRRKQQGCEFIDAEAEESGSSVESDDVSSSGLDDLDESFIDDGNNHSVDMKAKYLQSVRSPLVGKFKIPVNQHYTANVYSQYVENNTEYMNDSFCVDEEDSASSSEMSELELAEKLLSRKRRKKQGHRKEGKRRKSPILISDDEEGEKSICAAVGKKCYPKKTVIISDSETDITPQPKKAPLKRPRLNISSDSSVEKKKKKSDSVPSCSSQTSRKSLFPPTPKLAPLKSDEDLELRRALEASQKDFLDSVEANKKEKQDLEEAIRLSQMASKSKPLQDTETVTFSNLPNVVNRKKFVKKQNRIEI